MRKSGLVLLLVLFLFAGCSRPEPAASGIGAVIPLEEAIRMAKAGSPLTEVTYTDRYTAPPTVHVVHGKDQHGRQVIAWVYTTVIRSVYADQLISVEKALAIAQEAGFPVEAVLETTLRVVEGRVDGRDNPVFWRLSTKAGWIWVDAETGQVLKRLDPE